MDTLTSYLKENYGQSLTFEGNRVVWDKALLLTLRELGYDLQLENHATDAKLYFGDTCLGSILYEVEEVRTGEGKNDRYEVMLLDLTPFYFDEQVTGQEKE